MDKTEVFENYHFIIYKRLQILMCVWPYQNKSLKFFGQMIIIITIHTMMLPQAIKFFEELYDENRKLHLLAENFSGFIYFQGILSKMYMSIYTEKKLQHLYELITNDYKEIQDPGERAALAKLWSFARFLSMLYISYMFVACFVFVFTPTVVPAIFDIAWPLNESRPKSICIYAEYFIDQEKYFYHLILHTFVVCAVSLLLTCAVDNTYVAVTYHVLGLFNILTYRLKRLNDYTNSDTRHEDGSLHNFVKDTIKIHNKTFLAELVRSTYNAMFFALTGLLLVAFSIGTIEIMMSFTNLEIMLRIGVFWIGLVAYLFYINWPGQRFVDSSNELLESIYACNWYKLPVKTQLLLKIMMMRCLVPCQLTAGPLLRMNFENFGTVLRTAFSYFTAVSSLA